jgi:hypothetical protein
VAPVSAFDVAKILKCRRNRHNGGAPIRRSRANATALVAVLIKEGDQTGEEMAHLATIRFVR